MAKKQGMPTNRTLRQGQAAAETRNDARVELVTDAAPTTLETHLLLMELVTRVTALEARVARLDEAAARPERRDRARRW